MSRGFYAGASIDGRTIIVLVAKLGFAGVDCNANLELTDLAPILSVKAPQDTYGAFGSFAGFLKNDEVAVTLAPFFDELALAAVDALLNDAVVTLDRGAHGPRLKLPSAGASFDVGHQESAHRTRCSSTSQRVRLWSQ
jgi:hypothetical protein